jgi:hypothetical protein
VLQVSVPRRGFGPLAVTFHDCFWIRVQTLVPAPYVAYLLFLASEDILF